MGQGRLAQPDPVVQGSRRCRRGGTRRELGFHTLACASTGNLSASVAAAAAALGLRAVVFIPADLEPAKVAQAAALGATVVRVDGPYDDVNRLCLELTDELDGWAFLNVNLRPYYAEGSKTIAFEIAQQLGWRAPDVVVAPLASGSMFTKLARGFRELVAGRTARAARDPLRGRPGCGLRPVAGGHAAGGPVEPVGRPERSSARWPSARPRTASFARARAGERRQHRGSPRQDVVAAIRLLAETEGILTETAGGVTLARCARPSSAGSERATRSCWSSPATGSRRWTPSTSPPANRSRRPSPPSRRGGRAGRCCVSGVRIPPVLRDAVGGSRELPAAGGTVGRGARGLFTGHPALADRLRPTARSRPS